MLTAYLPPKQLHLQSFPTPKRAAKHNIPFSQFGQPKMIKKHSSLSELSRDRGVKEMGDFGFMTVGGVKKDEMFVIVKSRTFEFPPEQSLRLRLKKPTPQPTPPQTPPHSPYLRKPTPTPDKRSHQHRKQLMMMLSFEKRYREELEKKFLHRRLNLEKGLTSTRTKML